MSQDSLPFQYKSSKKSLGLTGFAGLPLYSELALKSGLVEVIESSLALKGRGWSDVEMIMSLILLNLAGGDCISDIERLEHDSGLRVLLLRLATHGLKRPQRRAYEKRWRKKKLRGVPSNAAIHRYLQHFHSPDEEKKRVVGEAFIPASNEALTSLGNLNQVLLNALSQHSPFTKATLDQDATLSYSYNRNALYSYKKCKAYQPFNTYWAELGALLHSEFRDGNVPAGYEQLRVFKTAVALLPASVTKVYLRSDSAGYQEELIRYCAEGKDERFGTIEFAIAARVSAGLKQAALELKPEAWQPIYKTEPDGSQTQTSQEWAEVCFVPNWAVKNKQQPNYRYMAIREAMKPSKTGKAIETSSLPFQTLQHEDTTYKLFAIVTNRTLGGSELIQWHRERCGKSEQVHHTQKEGLAGGKLPSNLFGANAAWWQIMILAFNLNRLMQIAALPSQFKEKKMKALRFHVIGLPGQLIRHARQVWLQVEDEANELYKFIRCRINTITKCGLNLSANTS